MIWFAVIMPIGLICYVCIRITFVRWRITCDIREMSAKLDAARAELAQLEALNPEDKEWLARVAGWERPTVQPMSDPTSYAMPVVGSVWEWQPGNPMAHEVVTVKETRGAEVGDVGSVWLEGPSGDRIVSLPDFAAGAVPAPLRHRR